MRVAVLLGLLVTAAAADDPPKPAKRYGVAADLKAYPQSTPKEALASALKAVAAKKVDYLLAHLADPAFVDDRVKRLYGGAFEEAVEDAQPRLDPSTVKLLTQFLKEGEWTTEKERAVVRLKDVKGRAVRLKSKDGRWFLDHPWAPPKK